MQNAAAGLATPADRPPVYSTLLALVQSLQGVAGSEEAVVDTARELVNSGRVILTGNFKGCRLEPERAH